MNPTKRSIGALLAGATLAMSAAAEEPSKVDQAATAASGVATRTGQSVKHGVESAASATERGLNAAGRGVKKGVEVGADAVKTTGERTADGVKRGVRRAEGWVGAGSAPKAKRDVPVEDRSSEPAKP